MSVGLARFVTDFADQAVVLPVALAMLAGLLLLGWRQAALAWAFAVGATLGATLFLKLAVMACGMGDSIGLASPSGHTAGAAAVYGGAAALAVRDSRRGVLAAAAFAALVAGVVGLTRLSLHVHSVADVCVGGLVGVAGAAAMRGVAGLRPASLNLPRLVAVAAVAMVVFHGHRLDAEPRLRWAADRIWPLSLCQAPAGPMKIKP